MLVLIENTLFFFLRNEGMNIIVTDYNNLLRIYKIPLHIFPHINFLANLKISLKILSYNLGHHIQTNEVQGSEALLVQQCQNKYPRRNGLVEYPQNINESFMSQCSYNAIQFLQQSDSDLIGLQEYQHKKFNEGNLFQFFTDLSGDNTLIKNKYHLLSYKSLVLIYNAHKLGLGHIIAKINIPETKSSHTRPFMIVYFPLRRLIVMNLHMPHHINITKTFSSVLQPYLPFIFAQTVKRIIILGDFNDYTNRLKTINITNPISGQNFLLTRNKERIKTCCADTNFEYAGDYIFDSNDQNRVTYYTKEILASDHYPIQAQNF